MNAAAHWQRVRALYHAAFDQPAEVRGAWLEKQCAADMALLAEVRRLLGEENAPDLLDRNAAELLGCLLPDVELPDVEGDDAAPQALGPYRLLRLLGTGGMGRVYLAERSDGQFRQQVALKVLRGEFASPDVRQRFLRERETLARLTHPNIAQLYDGGVAEDGTPYFTLEYVDGAPLTQWSDAQRLSPAQRVRLLLKVCDAVEYAHRNLVVHRDLKPTNVLVGADAEPKLLDFGIAKPLDEASTSLTATSSRPMTPGYAAPEQALGEPITTATDVYSLGVLLYILLCGRSPYRRAARGEVGWVKAIVEDAPEPLEHALERTAAATPSAEQTDPGVQELAAWRGLSVTALRRSLRGDAERIVQRALAKAPESRYPSVAALAQDLRALVEGRAIAGGTRTYRLRKLARRYWLPLGTAAAVLVLIVGSALALAWQVAQTASEARKAAAVKDFVLELFRNANPSITQGHAVTLRDVVDRGVQRLETIPAEQREMKAELQNTLGTIYFQIGQYREAATLHERAFESVKDIPASATLAAMAERNRALEISALGDNTLAQELADDAVRRLRAQPRIAAQDLSRALSTAGLIAKRRGDAARARQLGEEAFALAKQPPQDDALLQTAYSQRGTAAKMAHDYAAAVADYTQALALSTKLYGRTDQETISAQQLLGTALFNQAHFDAAREHLIAAFDASQQVFGAANPRTMRVGEMLALDELEAGRVADAQQRFAALLDSAAAATPRDDGLVAELQLNFAEILAEVGKLEQAEALLIAVREFLAPHPGSAPDEEAEALSALGYVHLLMGKTASAEQEQREALAMLQHAKIADTAQVQSALSRVLLAGGKTEEAVGVAVQARENALKVKGAVSHAAAWAYYCEGLALAAAGNASEAELRLRESLRVYARVNPPHGAHPFSAAARVALGRLLVAQPEHRDEGRQLLSDGLALREQLAGAADAQAIAARRTLTTIQVH
jgi:serine/threonine protein kinase